MILCVGKGNHCSASLVAGTLAGGAQATGQINLGMWLFGLPALFWPIYTVFVSSMQSQLIDDRLY